MEISDLIVPALMVLLAVGGTFLARLAGRHLASREAQSPQERYFGFLPSTLLWRAPRWTLAAVAVCLWILAAYHALGAVPAVAETRDLVGRWTVQVLMLAGSILTRPLFHLGDQGISASFLAGLCVLVAAVVWTAGFARSFIRHQVLGRTGMEVGVQEALATSLSYVFLAVGLLIALELVGIDLSTLAIIAGALSIGIGFGLQNIANNFISGLIILMERPIKVGDRIEIGGTHGRVVRISARSTAVRTNDNIDIIVPNAELISDRVTNWSQKDRRVRFRVPVGVAYGTDVDRALKLMEEAAGQIPEVLASPAPSARFMSFGDSSLDLELRIWTVKRLHRRGAIISDINRAIYYRFLEHGIQIPFPQRDLHIKSWPQGGPYPPAS